jgi:hypothetical protein
VDGVARTVRYVKRDGKSMYKHIKACFLERGYSLDAFSDAHAKWLDDNQV